MPGRGNLQSVPQQGFDEQPIEDKELEEALEHREALKAVAAEHRKAYDEANDTAKGLVARLELPEGGAARVGRFRISRQEVAAKTVHFESKASSRILIELAK